MIEPFASPRGGPIGAAQNWLANSLMLKRIRRGLLGRLPFPVLESQVRDIIYANWVVPIAAVADRIPSGVRLVERNGQTILTVLTYAHGHFGPVQAGPLRRLFPSPLQSNWRLYVADIDGKTPVEDTVLFVANAFDSDLYALGTRVFSDAMLSHRAEYFEHRTVNGAWLTRLGGRGSAPSLNLHVGRIGQGELPQTFRPFFASLPVALQKLCLQHAAIAPTERSDRLALAGIDLPIALDTVQFLQVLRYEPGELLKQWQAGDVPFCFRVPSVRFRAVSERLIST
ncbi:uncharacterized protein DUF2071 [Novosphingobium sp. PhB165]|uniref:DUF2071 domain-containing protein n=1 Tax=Novosphingobium sp. PhB165 TaxID=2485105 RepID=UPI0010433EF3|nr:DUF2071 domain-containing protein [Novosphingobium sp. PhB165]TCM17817.1 uncharacterized protein DUF2071 [Novosphingobium sp. PhB165]